MKKMSQEFCRNPGALSLFGTIELKKSKKTYQFKSSTQGRTVMKLNEEIKKIDEVIRTNQNIYNYNRKTVV